MKISSISEALEVLGLEPGVSYAEVKETYRDLAKIWHPDRFAETSRVRSKAEEEMKRINAAYAFIQNRKDQLSRDASDFGHSTTKSNHPRPKTNRPSSPQKAEKSQVGGAPPTPTVRVVLFVCLCCALLLWIVASQETRTPESETVWTQSTEVEESGNGRTPPNTLVPQPAVSANPIETDAREQKVTELTSSEERTLARSHATPAPTQSRLASATFSVGSSTEDVLRVQGSPDEFNDRRWRYGLSYVYFSNGRVVSWDESTLNPLRARLELTSSVDRTRTHFTVGSTKDEVVSIQGSPDEFNDRRWRYGLSYVYFSNGRVVSWNESTLNPLKARLE